MWADDEVKTHVQQVRQEVRTQVTEELDAEGRLVRVTRQVKLTRRPVRVSRHVLQRRALPKFGAAERGSDGCTTVDHTAVDLRLGLAPAAAASAAAPDLGPVPVLVVCQLCQEAGHWTLKCPKRLDAGRLDAGPPRLRQERQGEGQGGRQGDKFSVCLGAPMPTFAPSKKRTRPWPGSMACSTATWCSLSSAPRRGRKSEK